MTVLLLLLLPHADAQEVRGFVEARAAWAVGADGFPVQLVQRARPTFEAPLSDRVTLSTTVEVGVAEGRNTTTVLKDTLADSDLGPLLDLAGCTWPTPDNRLFGTSDAGDYLHVERLTLDWYHPKFDLRVGRQAVQWGSALFINPTDPFPQVIFTEPWRPRAGVNAARLTVPIGDLHQVQALVGTNDDFTAPRVAARATANWQQTDWSAVAAWRQESDELLTGVDIKGTLGVGFWLEGGVRVRDLSASPTVSQTLALGVDYSLPVLNTVYLAAQYVRNDAPAGATPTAGLSGLQGPTCDADGPFGPATDADPFAPFLTGTDYALLVANADLTPDLSSSVAWLQNLGDGSGLLIPSLTVRLPGQIDVAATAQIPVRTWGDGGELSPSASSLVLTVPDTTLSADLSGLVPSANVVLWTRLSF